MSNSVVQLRPSGPIAIDLDGGTERIVFGTHSGGRPELVRDAEHSLSSHFFVNDQVERGRAVAFTDEPLRVAFRMPGVQTMRWSVERAPDGQEGALDGVRLHPRAAGLYILGLALDERLFGALDIAVFPMEALANLGFPPAMAARSRLRLRQIVNDAGASRESIIKALESPWQGAPSLNILLCRAPMAPLNVSDFGG